MSIGHPLKRQIELTAQGSGVVSTSLVWEVHPAAIGVSVFTYMSENGQLTVLRQDLSGNLAVLATQAITAETLDVQTFDYNPGRLVFEFVPSANDCTGYVESTYYGHGGGLS